MSDGVFFVLITALMTFGAFMVVTHAVVEYDIHRRRQARKFHPDTPPIGFSDRTYQWIYMTTIIVSLIGFSILNAIIIF